MKKSKIKATTIRIFLVIVIFIIMISGIGGFYYAQNWLDNFTVEINNNSKKTTIKEPTTKDIERLQKQITDNQEVIENLNSIFYTKQDYKNQAFQDINRYAAIYNIGIDTYSSTQDVNNPNIGTVTLTVKNPIQFDNFINFLKAIETNKPKMQLTSINISLADINSGNITVGPLNIKVYLK